METLSGSQTRIPPHNLEAEIAVLGSILLDNGVLDSLANLVTPKDFYRESHRLIYTRVMELSAKAMAVDTVTLYDALLASGELEQAGGVEHLARLAEAVPTAANAQHYARIVHEKAMVRRFVAVTGEYVEEAFHGVTDVADFLDRAESAILAVGDKRDRIEPQAVSELLSVAFDQLEARMRDQREVTGLTTGFVDLDKLTAGLQRSDLIILAARPSMGKTAFCLNLAVNAALMGQAKVAVFSLEMSREQLVTRMLSTQARVSQEKIRTGFLSDRDFDDLYVAADDLAKTHIFIDDTPSLSNMELRSKCRRLNAEHGLDMIVIDYLQLMKGPQHIKSREQEISEISRSLKALAKELDVPVLALSQLNRELEKRQDKRPKMSDLRESGAIEQDADIITFIYRDEVYNEDSKDKGIAEIILSKHRNGALGTVRLAFLGACTRFDNLADERYGL